MVVEQLSNIKYKLQSMEQEIKNLEQYYNDLQLNLDELNSDMTEILETKTYYKKAIDIICERSVVELKDLLNTCLANAYPDRNFTMDIVISDKRGKSMTFTIYEDGKPADLKTGMGMGVKCIISAVLHMYYLQCKNSKVILLDEAYSNIDKEHLPNFFEFIGKLCEQLGFKMIIITHDERFLDYGNKTYTINQGKVKSSD